MQPPFKGFACHGEGTVFAEGGGFGDGSGRFVFVAFVVFEFVDAGFDVLEFVAQVRSEATSARRTKSQPPKQFRQK